MSCPHKETISSLENSSTALLKVEAIEDQVRRTKRGQRETEIRRRVNPAIPSLKRQTPNYGQLTPAHQLIDFPSPQCRKLKRAPNLIFRSPP